MLSIREVLDLPAPLDPLVPRENLADLVQMVLAETETMDDRVHLVPLV